MGGEVGVVSGEVAGSVWWHASTIPRAALSHIGRQATPRVRLATYVGDAHGRMPARGWSPRFEGGGSEPVGAAPEEVAT